MPASIINFHTNEDTLRLVAGYLHRKLLKGQTGHLTDDMIGGRGNPRLYNKFPYQRRPQWLATGVFIELYSDHETVGDREIIHTVSREVFAGLIPEKPKMLVFRKEKLAEAACG